MALLEVDAKNKAGVLAQFRKHGIYYTDPKLAEELRSRLPADVSEVYDPTAGCGSLLACFGDEVHKVGQELDPAQAAECSRLPNCECAAGNTLTDPAHWDRRFAAIVANYPFSVRWAPEAHKTDPRYALAPAMPPAGKADYAFILHIWYMLAPGGVACVICPMGVLYRGLAEGQIRRWLLEQGAIESVTIFPGGAFVDTRIGVALMVMRKGREPGAVLVEDRRPEGAPSREVALAEIADREWSLHPALYLPPPPPPPLPPPADACTIGEVRAMAEKFSALLAEGMILAERCEETGDPAIAGLGEIVRGHIGGLSAI